jgi:acetoin utilization deacetylase AcuC-like enzyme
MHFFYHPSYLKHDTGFHPESAERLKAIVSALEQHGIPESQLARPQPADHTLLAEVHDARYIAEVARLAASGGGHWDLDTYISPGSYEAATLAAGAAVEAAECALSGEPAFALVRPPGHHALFDSALGFCIFNNVAVAAQHCVRSGLERVMIVDWDVHHGNGTQDYFYDRSDVLFFSSHQYPFYPGTGSLREIGGGEGTGYTVNVPLPEGVGDEGYVRVFEEILVPLAVRYRPQIILVSAGYDAHAADLIGGMAVTVAGFHSLAATVRRLSLDIMECTGRLALILEGGYNTSALAASLLATVAAVDEGRGTEAESRPLESAVSEEPNPVWPRQGRRAPDISNLIAEVKKVHRLD